MSALGLKIFAATVFGLIEKFVIDILSKAYIGW